MQCCNLSADLNQVLGHAFEVVVHVKVFNLLKPGKVGQFFRNPSEFLRGIIIIEVVDVVNQVAEFGKVFAGLS